MKVVSLWRCPVNKYHFHLLTESMGKQVSNTRQTNFCAGGLGTVELLVYAHSMMCQVLVAMVFSE